MSAALHHCLVVTVYTPLVLFCLYIISINILVLCMVPLLLFNKENKARSIINFVLSHFVTHLLILFSGYVCAVLAITYADK